MSITAGIEAVVRQARDFVCQSAEFRDAVDEAFEAVADSSESSFLGSLLPGQQRRPGVGRSAAGHVATRAFTACTAPLHRAGLPVPVPTTREIDAVFEANSSDGAVLDRAEFRSFCAELLVRAVGRMIEGVARTFGPPVLAGIGAVWLLRITARAAISPLHRLLSPLLLGPVLGIYVACAQTPPGAGPGHDPRELLRDAASHAAALREAVRRQTRQLLRRLR